MQCTRAAESWCQSCADELNSVVCELDFLAYGWLNSLTGVSATSSFLQVVYFALCFEVRNDWTEVPKADD